MQDPEKELKQEKKIGRIMWRSMGAGGIGIGLFLMRFLVAPFLGDNEAAMAALTTFSLCLVGFAAVMIATFVFKRTLLPKVWLLMTWVVLPAVLLKLLFDVF